MPREAEEGKMEAEQKQESAPGGAGAADEAARGAGERPTVTERGSSKATVRSRRNNINILNQSGALSKGVPQPPAVAGAAGAAADWGPDDELRLRVDSEIRNIPHTTIRSPQACRMPGSRSNSRPRRTYSGAVS